MKNSCILNICFGKLFIGIKQGGRRWEKDLIAGISCSAALGRVTPIQGQTGFVLLPWKAVLMKYTVVIEMAGPAGWLDCGKGNKGDQVPKYNTCMNCDFYWHVREEAGDNFELTLLLQNHMWDG